MRGQYLFGPVRAHHSLVKFPQDPVIGPRLGLHPADDHPALLGAHHELAGDGGLEAQAVDAGRKLRVFGVGRLHAVLTHWRGEVPDMGA